MVPCLRHSNITCMMSVRCARRVGVVHNLCTSSQPGSSASAWLGGLLVVPPSQYRRGNNIAGTAYALRYSNHHAMCSVQSRACTLQHRVRLPVGPHIYSLRTYLRYLPKVLTLPESSVQYLEAKVRFPQHGRRRPTKGLHYGTCRSAPETLLCCWKMALSCHDWSLLGGRQLSRRLYGNGAVGIQSNHPSSPAGATPLNFDTISERKRTVRTNKVP